MACGFTMATFTPTPGGSLVVIPLKLMLKLSEQHYGSVLIKNTCRLTLLFSYYNRHAVAFSSNRQPLGM